jgi:hypothetical protein
MAASNESVGVNNSADTCHGYATLECVLGMAAKAVIKQNDDAASLAANADYCAGRNPAQTMHLIVKQATLSA